MKRQRFVSPRSLSRLLTEAAEAWKRQDYQQTLDVLERVTRMDPANPGLHLDLGRAYGLRYRYEEAERCFEKAARVALQRAGTLIEAGRRCQEFGNYSLARRYFERAAEEKGAPADVFVALAEIEERHARLTEALALVERALRLDSGSRSARLAKARLDRLTGRLTDAEAGARALLEGKDSDPWQRARAWYELGHILDRQGRYDQAMDAFLEAKAIVRPAAAHHALALRGIQARVREMEETITSGMFERWEAAASELGPPRQLAILCGHPRSGTTLLEQILDAHPEIVTAEETHILHDEAYLPLSRGVPAGASVRALLESAAACRLRQSREDYFRTVEAFLGTRLGSKTLVDKNPALNVLIPAIARIFPEAKLLVALRDPRDVCLSCFMQPLAPNPVSSAYLSLEGTVTQYLSVMGFWVTMRPRLRNPFLEIRYEELVEDLEAVARRALSFLGVAWDASVMRFHEHARGKLVRSPSYAEVSKPVSKQAIGRWQNYRLHLEPFMPRLEPMLKALRYG